ncbi:MAG: hypothetical protein KIS92_15770 [Planctomycetota bacterium]|nr:hypothetical protein [Planctomycetota bacterium]
MPSTYFILAGEASGDMHAAKLIEAWKTLEPDARFVGMGGPKMAAAGLEVAKDLDGMQVVGFWEVAKKYGFFRSVFYTLLDRVKQERPAALICIDYPGFNLRFAKEVRKLGIPCLYYIVPQVWAWKPKRAGQMAEYIDRAYCVFDFEPPFFDKFRTPQRKMKTVFVGHPILDQPKVPKLELPPGPKTVSFLPGSRQNEFFSISVPCVTGFLVARGQHPNCRGLFSLSAGIPKWKAKVLDLVSVEDVRGPELRETQLSPEEGITTATIKVGPQSQAAICDGLFQSEKFRSISHASLLPSVSDFSVVKSGTSTLEAGLQGNPMCVVYKGGTISYAIARLLVDIPCFSLVNIVLGRYAVPELLQSEVNPQRIAAEIERGLTDRKYIDAQRAALAELPGKLGGPGASKRAAQGMIDFLKGKE